MKISPSENESGIYICNSMSVTTSKKKRKILLKPVLGSVTFSR